MAWINTVPPQAADADLKLAYEKITSARGKLSNIMQIQSLDPKAMTAHLDLYLALMFGRSGLSRAERELVAILVSSVNGCDYCVQHHAAALAAWWKDSARVQQLITDYEGAGLTPRELALAYYAVTLTRAPADVNEQDIQLLRSHGLQDADILKLNMIVAYFNFVNRIAEGLGVEFNEEEAAGYRY